MFNAFIKMTLFFWCISFLCTLYDDVQIQNLGAKVGAFMAVVRQMWYIVTCRRKHLGRRFFTLIETSWLQELDLMELTYSKASFFAVVDVWLAYTLKRRFTPKVDMVPWKTMHRPTLQSCSLSFHETISSPSPWDDWSKGWMDGMLFHIIFFCPI